jgi:DNA-binding response OmpR family regulator
MRILVVEDERVAAEVLAKGLREHAYAVDVASDGVNALEQAGTNDYDLIVLDCSRASTASTCAVGSVPMGSPCPS